MTSAKRRALTTNDLMRRQEEPDRKRIRKGGQHVDQEGSVSVEEASENETVGSNNELDEDIGEFDEEDGSGDSQDEVVDLKDEAPTTSPPERFDFSRIKPRAQVQFSTHIPSKSTSSDTFLSLGVSASLQAALSTMSIRTPTGVQAACIPPLLAGEFSRNSRG